MTQKPRKTWTLSHRSPFVPQVMNDVVFPERLDFGVHALGETKSRTVKMVCKVRYGSIAPTFDPEMCRASAVRVLT